MPALKKDARQQPRPRNSSLNSSRNSRRCAWPCCPPLRWRPSTPMPSRPPLPAGEILLTACVSRQENDQQGPVLAVQPQKAVGMSPESAKRLAAALVQAIQQYEARYGEIDL